MNAALQRQQAAGSVLDAPRHGQHEAKEERGDGPGDGDDPQRMRLHPGPEPEMEHVMCGRRKATTRATDSEESARKARSNRGCLGQPVVN